MFDVATLPQSPNAGTQGAAVPFDWRLCTPGPVANFPWKDYAQAAGVISYVDPLAVYALALEDTLQTAVILSLFTDRRARDDDALPSGVAERRGWVGDEFVSAQGDSWGSRLWLCYSGKVTGDVLEKARFAAQESLNWMVRDGIASRVDVVALWAASGSGQLDRLAVRPTIYKPGNTSPVYDVLWGTSIKRYAQ
jgi:phage gp46-like protein